MSNKKPLPRLFFHQNLTPLGFEIIPLKHFFKKYPRSFLQKTKVIKFYQLLVITKSDGEHCIDFRPYKYTRRSIILVGKHQTHSWTVNLKNDGYLMLFTDEFLYQNQMVFDALSFQYPYNSVLYPPVKTIGYQKEFICFLELIELISKEFKIGDDVVKKSILQSLLNTFFLKLQRHMPIQQDPSNSSHQNLFIQLQHALSQHLAYTKTASDYVDLLGVSYHQLNNTVKLHARQTLKAFIDDNLVLKAKKMLVDENYTINEIADHLGFDEATNFTKFFKNNASQTPKAFRKLFN